MSKLIKPGRTKLISVTSPHNPTGLVLNQATIDALADLATKSGARLLVDETYRGMTFSKEGILPVQAGRNKSVISVSSMSKTYGLPGIRLGWVVTKDKQLMQTFLAAKESIIITGSVLDEEVADQFLANRQQRQDQIVKEIRSKFEIVKKWMALNSDLIEWVEPEGGCLCFPRIKNASKEIVDRFYSILNDKYGTYTGPGHWFEMERRYMRIGYGWPDEKQLI